MTTLRECLRVLIGGLCLLLAAPGWATNEGEPGIVPPRLSMLEGGVSFWRPGNDDWQTARINTPISVGDALAADAGGRLELQVAGRAFLRADGGSQFQLDAQSADFLRFRVIAGVVSLDIRGLPDGLTVEVGTPAAALSISTPGYYRVEVEEERTRIATRRGGSLELTTVGGGTRSVGSDVDVRVESTGAEQVVANARLDDWDRWNLDRGEQQISGNSRRYVGDEIYGTEDLDRYGRWQVVPTYGRVWVPPVAPSWVPYSTGEWVWDSYYGWTWIDAAPWGWAPFHYGRWVYARSYWAWAPGPLVVQPVYAPALVAFFGGNGFSVGVSVGVPAVSWVALGWGEPCVPWWGSAGFVGYPWWGGWGGPHVVNQTIIDNSTHVNIDTVNVYEHARDGRGVVGVPRERFGNSPVERARLTRVEAQRLGRSDDLLPRRPTVANRLPHRDQPLPQDAVLTRPVVTVDPSARRQRAASARELPSRFGGSENVHERSASQPGGQPLRESESAANERSGSQARAPRRPAEASPPSQTTSLESQSTNRPERRSAERDWDRWREMSPRFRTTDAPASNPLQPREQRVDLPPSRDSATQRPHQGDLPGSGAVDRSAGRAPRRPSGSETMPSETRPGGADTNGWSHRVDREPVGSPHVASPPQPRAEAGGSQFGAGPERAPRRPMSPDPVGAVAPIAPAPRVEAPAPAPRMDTGGSFGPRERSRPSLPEHFQSAAPAAAAPQAGGQAGMGSGGGSAASERHPHHR